MNAKHLRSDGAPITKEWDVLIDNTETVGYTVAITALVFRGAQKPSQREKDEVGPKCTCFIFSKDGQKLLCVKNDAQMGRKTKPMKMYTYAATEVCKTSIDKDDAGDLLYPFATMRKLGADGTSNQKPKFEYEIDGAGVVIQGATGMDDELRFKGTFSNEAGKVAATRTTNRNVKDANGDWTRMQYKEVSVAAGVDAVAALALGMCSERLWYDSIAMDED